MEIRTGDAGVKILLMDLDVIKQRRPFPNLALMKLSTYYKAKGDQVLLNFPLDPPDITYASCVFTWNERERGKIPPGAGIGGLGINLKAELPPEVEHIMPDYSLYPNVSPLVKDSSIGFTSRGCIRRCPWCFVPEKEGGIKPWARIYEFWHRCHRKIVLLDNNLLAAPNWRQTMEDLLAEGLGVDFNQGLDIRMLDEKKAEYLRRLKTKELRFAFDSIGCEKAVRQGVELLTGYGIRSRKLSFYTLIGYDGDTTAIDRMRILCSLNVDVYPMIYVGRDGKISPSTRALLRQIRDKVGIEGMLWHGPRNNIKKFLRYIARLPE